jgi:3-dehydrotetronate 4-kinase
VKLSLGCIADDYTGASDLANTLTRAGLRTVQTIGVPSGDLALPEVDAVVVSLKSRSIAADLAVSGSRAAEKWLRGRGADHVLFKICSTFDRHRWRRVAHSAAAGWRRRRPVRPWPWLLRTSC